MKDIIIVSRDKLARERELVKASGRRVVSEHALPSGGVMLKVKPDRKEPNATGPLPVQA